MNPNSHPLSRRRFVEQSSLWAGLAGTAALATARADQSAPAEKSEAMNASVVNARAFGACGDGRTDDTPALQAALDAATAKGPLCFVPAGMYRLAGALTVPPGVTLCGASGGVPHSEHPIGTVLLAFGGRGEADGAPLITLKPNAVVWNLVGLRSARRTGSTSATASSSSRSSASTSTTSVMARPMPSSPNRAATFVRWRCGWIGHKTMPVRSSSTASSCPPSRSDRRIAGRSSSPTAVSGARQPHKNTSANSAPAPWS
ncbi:MAG: hypothetical protein FJ387_25730 [Verrucomicrobia bacterium]|nr:hypothetical protein [Verrucomicrobiota bacterium]